MFRFFFVVVADGDKWKFVAEKLGLRWRVQDPPQVNSKKTQSYSGDVTVTAI